MNSPKFGLYSTEAYYQYALVNRQNDATNSGVSPESTKTGNFKPDTKFGSGASERYFAQDATNLVEDGYTRRWVRNIADALSPKRLDLLG
jgi:hypothetical protein